MAEKYAKKLKKDGHSAVALLTGSLTTEERLNTIKNAWNGRSKVLIATDGFRRGIDIPNTKIVVNFDLPFSSDSEPSYKVYLHRSGRTGRFGRHGIIITLIDTQHSLEAYNKISQSFNFVPKQIFC